MQYQNSKTRFSRALTLVEMLIAMSIMAIVFAAILPQFRAIQNSWDSKQAAAETLQNSRVLMEHLYRNFSKAVKITAVSDSAETNGYIEFEDNVGDTLRYDVAASNYVEFGPVGDLYELAGPVSQLLFTCYDGIDFDTAITNVNSIRFVKVEAILTNSSPMGRDITLETSTYLRTNVSSLVGWWKLDESSGLTAADSSGNGNDGTLTNMAGDEWTTGVVGGALEFGGGPSTRIKIPADASLDLTLYTTWTMSAWVKPTSYVGTKWPTVFEYGIDATLGLAAKENTDGLIEHWQNDVTVFHSNNPATLNAWNHIAIVRDPTNTTFYLNGVADGSGASVAITGGGQVSWIGGDENNNPGDDDFLGLIDDVRIYNRAMIFEEVAGSAGILRYEEFTEAKLDSDGTSLTISTPGGVSEGSLLIAAVATDGDTTSSLAPPLGEGWTQINLNDYNNEVTLGVWWKLADASESSSHEFTWSGVQQAYGWMMRFTGHDLTDPIDIWAANGMDSTNPTSPGVTTSVDNSLILRIGAFDGNDITIDAPGLSGHTAITMDASSSGGATYEEFTEEKVSTNNTKITIDTPAGTSEDDLLIAAVVTESDTSGSLAPPGGEDWTEIDVDDQGGKVTLGVWWKLADASESPSHEFTWSVGKKAYGWIMRFTGHDTSSTIDATAVGGGKSGTPESPAVTTTVANAVILRIGGFKGKDITVDAPGLSGHTAITMDQSDKCSGGAGYKIQSAIGSSGTSNFSLNRSKEYRVVTIAIAPDPADGGGADSVSGGAGYIKELAIGSSGTSDFALTASEESRTLTIAIAPEASGIIEVIRP